MDILTTNRLLFEGNIILNVEKTPRRAYVVVETLGIVSEYSHRDNYPLECK